MVKFAFEALNFNLSHHRRRSLNSVSIHTPLPAPGSPSKNWTFNLEGQRHAGRGSVFQSMRRFRLRARFGELDFQS
jgi:hypothetical protein